MQTTWQTRVCDVRRQVAYKGRTEFDAGKGLLAFLSVIAAIVLVIALWTTLSNEALWIRAVCWAIFGLTVLGAVDAATSFVKLGTTCLVYRANFRTREIKRKDIGLVSVEKGCPVTVCLKDGTKIQLPPIGQKGIGNSLRAWTNAA